MRHFFGIFICCFLLSAIPAMAAEITGRVVGVHDGDTITVLDSRKQTTKIRLAEIDAPELKQPYGQKSKQYLALHNDDKIIRQFSEH